MAVVKRLQRWAGLLRRDVHVLYLAGRDPRVSVVVKLAALAIAVYALSPIDLIPDFIPLLGYIDELLLLPAAIWLVLRLIPADIVAEHRATAAATRDRIASRTGAALVFALWIAAATLLLWLMWPDPAE